MQNARMMMTDAMTARYVLIDCANRKMRFYILIPNADVAKADLATVLAKQMPCFIQAPRVDTYRGGLPRNSSSMLHETFRKPSEEEKKT